MLHSFWKNCAHSAQLSRASPAEPLIDLTVVHNPVSPRVWVITWPGKALSLIPFFPLMFPVSNFLSTDPIAFFFSYISKEL